ncbi:NUDIX hydrolase [Rhodovulum sp. YEN HP10]|uniref:NUDIX hydrolase n=1 Tax=Rhodovulum sp. HP10 TaxID=3387397 RepID=UPI0039DFDC6F
MATKTFRQPVVTVDAVLLTIEEDILKVLLHRRQQDPFAGRWALPGGFVHPDEDRDLPQTVSRILRDKAGLAGVYLEQLRTYAGPDRDPRGWSVSIAYLALVPRDALPEELDERTSLHPVSGLPDLPFDHGRQIADAAARLRGKGAYSSLPAAFLPESFTLPMLQRTYEIVLGEALDQSSFRRKIADLGFLEETGEKSKAASARPARLYRLTEPVRIFNRSLGGNQA